ncbi:HAD-IA family hydrolase [Paenibacillus xylanexedens]|uniref:HAD-IA family hydrolase n=1 Tax=Paenibacillus xylanexedens TaxID=528191 RepID=UPI0011A448FC|nr:HAD-IA family hydrolase [Paenibacillus xylanexedens]
MKGRPQIVLDIAGILLSNMSATCWEDMAQEFNLSADTLKEHFKGIKRGLWMGSMKEEQFWEWLIETYPTVPLNRAKEIILNAIIPLPASQYLEGWSKLADIHLLSNHCKEWIEPNMSSINKFAKSVTISNQVGLCKPDIEIYKLVDSFLPVGEEVLFIDDQEKNLKSAKALGWTTILADEHCNWINELHSKLL